MSAKGNAIRARMSAYAMLPLMARLWTREEKRDVLAGYDDASVQGTREMFLAIQGLNAATLDIWRSENEAGTLADDEDEDNGPVRVDRSILDLVELFRGVLAGAQRADVRPAYNTDSWDVLFGADGNWRANYLARARSALLVILAGLKRDPSELKLRGNDASAVIAQVRAYWGVDEIPVDPGDVGNERTARLKRNRRWSEQICCSRVAAVALRDWLRSTSDASDEPPTIACDVPPVWPGSATEWPPSEERRFLVRQVVRRLSSATARTEAQAMVVNDARALEILRRRAVELHDHYLRRGKGQADGFWYLQQEITRPWQSGISMIDLRTPAERADPERTVTSGRRRWSAISAMCMYSVVAEWDERAIEKIRLKMWALAQELPGEEPEHKFRKRALANRQALRTYPKIVNATTPAPPPFVAKSSSQVQDLFAAAQLLRLAKGATYLRIYLNKRTRIELSSLSDASLRVVQLSDYSVNLDIASRGVRRNIPADLLRAARTYLLQAAQRGGSVYSAIAYRNEALGLQRVDFSGAIATGTRGITELAKADDRGTADAEREAMEIDEQLSLSLAGCHVQWLEHLLSGTDRWVRSFEPDQWVEHCKRALYWIERAVEGIEHMYDRGQLKGPRYAVGHLSDESWLFRAWEIYYRCVCAIATAQRAFGIATPVLAPDLLERIARRVTQLPAAIPEAQLPRLLHSMLWHSFLSQNVLPALQPDTVNASLVRVDPITKVLTPSEVGDDNATITMTDDRVKLLTDFLINVGWSAGAIGEFTPGSAVWFALDHASGGAYGRWREEFDGLLHEDLQSE